MNNTITLKYRSDIQPVLADLRKIGREMNQALSSGDTTKIEAAIAKIAQLERSLLNTLGTVNKMVDQARNGAASQKAAFDSSLARTRSSVARELAQKYAKTDLGKDPLGEQLKAALQKISKPGDRRSYAKQLEAAFESIISDAFSGVGKTATPARRALSTAGKSLSKRSKDILEATHALERALLEAQHDLLEFSKVSNQVAAGAKTARTQISRAKRETESAIHGIDSAVTSYATTVAEGMRSAKRQIGKLNTVSEDTVRSIAAAQAGLAAKITQAERMIADTRNKLSKSERKKLSGVVTRGRAALITAQEAVGGSDYVGTIARDVANAQFEARRRQQQIRSHGIYIDADERFNAAKDQMSSRGVLAFDTYKTQLQSSVGASQARVKELRAEAKRLASGGDERDIQRNQILLREAMAHAKRYRADYRAMEKEFLTSTSATPNRVNASSQIVEAMKVLKRSVGDTRNYVSSGGADSLYGTHRTAVGANKTALERMVQQGHYALQSGLLTKDEATELRTRLKEAEAQLTAHYDRMEALQRRYLKNREQANRRADRDAKTTAKRVSDESERSARQSEMRQAMLALQRLSDPSNISKLGRKGLVGAQNELGDVRYILSSLINKKGLSVEDRAFRDALFGEFGISNGTQLRGMLNATKGRISEEQDVRGRSNVGQRFLASIFGRRFGGGGGGPSDPYGRRDNGFFNYMNKMTTRVGGLAGVSLYGMGTIGAGTAFVGSAVKQSVEAETMTNSLAGMVNQFMEFKDAQGEVVKGGEKFVQSLEMAKRLYADIRTRANESILTTKEMFDYMLAGAPQLYRKGLKSNDVMDMIDKVASIGKGMNLPETAVQSDIRDLATGQVTVRSQVLRTMGFDPGKLKQAGEAGPQALKKYFDEVFKGFEPAFERLKNLGQSSLSQFVDRMNRMMIKAGDGITEGLLGRGNAIDKLGQEVDEWVQSGRAEEFGRSIGSMLTGLVDKFTWFIDKVGPLVSNVNTVIFTALALAVGRFALQMKLESIRLSDSGDKWMAGASKFSIGVGILLAAVSLLSASAAAAAQKGSKAVSDLEGRMTGSPASAQERAQMDRDTALFLEKSGFGGLAEISKRQARVQEQLGGLKSAAAKLQAASDIPFGFGALGALMDSGSNSVAASIYGDLGVEGRKYMKGTGAFGGTLGNIAGNVESYAKGLGGPLLQPEYVTAMAKATRSIYGAANRKLPDLGFAQPGAEADALLVRKVVQDYATLPAQIRANLDKAFQNLVEAGKNGSLYQAVTKDVETVRTKLALDLQSVLSAQGLRMNALGARLGRMPDGAYAGGRNLKYDLFTQQYGLQLDQATVARNLALSKIEPGNLNMNNKDFREAMEAFRLAQQKATEEYENNVRALRDSIIAQRDELALKRQSNAIARDELALKKRSSMIEYLSAGGSALAGGLYGARQRLSFEQGVLGARRTGLANRGLDNQIAAELRKADPFEKVVAFFGKLKREGLPLKLSKDTETSLKELTEEARQGIQDFNTQATMMGQSMGSLKTSIDNLKTSIDNQTTAPALGDGSETPVNPLSGPIGIQPSFPPVNGPVKDNFFSLKKLREYQKKHPALPTLPAVTADGNVLGSLQADKEANQIQLEEQQNADQMGRLQTARERAIYLNAQRIARFESRGALQRSLMNQSPSGLLSSLFLGNAQRSVDFLNQQRGDALDFANTTQGRGLGMITEAVGADKIGAVQDYIDSPENRGKLINAADMFHKLGMNVTEVVKKNVQAGLDYVQASYQMITTAETGYQNALNQLARIQSRIAEVLDDAAFEFDMRMRTLDAARRYNISTYGETGVGGPSAKLRAQAEFVRAMGDIENTRLLRNLPELNNASALLRDPALASLVGGSVSSLLGASDTPAAYREAIAKATGVSTKYLDRVLSTGQSADDVKKLFGQENPGADLQKFDVAIALAMLDVSKFRSVLSGVTNKENLGLALSSAIEGLITSSEEQKNLIDRVSKDMESQAALLERRNDIEQELIDLHQGQRERLAQRDYSKALDLAFSAPYTATDPLQELRQKLEDDLAKAQEDIKMTRTNELLEYVNKSIAQGNDYLKAIAVSVATTPEARAALNAAGISSTSGPSTIDAISDAGSATNTMAAAALAGAAGALGAVANSGVKFSGYGGGQTNPTTGLANLGDFERKLNNASTADQIKLLEKAAKSLPGLRPHVLKLQRQVMFEQATGSLLNDILANPTGVFNSGASFMQTLFSAGSPYIEDFKRSQQFRTSNIIRGLSGGLSKADLDAIGAAGDYRSTSPAMLALMGQKNWFTGKPTAAGRGAQARFAKTQLGYAAMDIGGSLVGNYLGQAVGGDPGSVSMGSTLGGAVAPLLFSGLGAWAGPVGMVVGGLLGGLFGKKRAQADPREEQHRQRVEDLLGSMDKSLRQIGGPYGMIKGTALWGQAPRYLSGRYLNSMGLAGAYGDRI